MNTNDAGDIKKRVDFLAMAGRDTSLKRVASTGGGEWAGSCPLPGCNCNHDGFRVQPNSPDGGQWYCRGCGDGRWHDVFDYIQRRDNCDFKTALETAASLAGVPIASSEQTPEVDRGKWRAAASEFEERCGDNLFLPAGRTALEWLNSRGLENETITFWRLGYNPKDQYAPISDWGFSDGKVWLPRGIMIPCRYTELHYINIRRPKESPKYVKIRGSKGWIFGSRTFKQPFIYIFESELDALLAWQEARKIGFDCAVGSFPAGNTFHVEWASELDQVEDYIIARDNDDEGRKHGERLCALHNRIYATTFPHGKDLTEFHQAGGDVALWLIEALNIMGGTQ